jgi:ankyrin repeat protein
MRDRELQDAAWDGDFYGAKVLLAAGADPRADRSCALMHAAHRGHPHIVELLLKAGADPRERRSESLMRAAKGSTARHRHCVCLLLGGGAATVLWDEWEWRELKPKMQDWVRQWEIRV